MNACTQYDMCNEVEVVPPNYPNMAIKCTQYDTWNEVEVVSSNYPSVEIKRLYTY